MAEEVARAYETLLRRARELGVLESCSSLLGWDEQTYMPEGGSSHRGEQMGLLAGLQHERATDPRIGELLDTLEGSELAADPDSPTAANIRELRRGYDRRTKLPRELVEELARTTSLAQQAWIAARREASFPQFRPWLEKIVQLKRDEGACLSAVTSSAGATEDAIQREPSAYDALLDEYEPGSRSDELAVLFQALRKELVPLVRAIGDASAKRGKAGTVLKQSYPADRQKVFGEMVASAVGFDFQKGRLDVTAHPFCSGIGPGDTRISTRYDDHNFSESFFGILHEVGHGLYEQGLPVEHFGTPNGSAASLGVHESQSRLWENAVGRSRAFWTFWYPLAMKVFHQPLHDVSLDQFLMAINEVGPGLIRTNADEVTYNLHIIIRFELEKALLGGELAPADLPAAWNQQYRELLGVTPSNDAEGCLQDIHWSAGLFGYFPTYTLGNLYAAQLFAEVRDDLGDLDEAFARGDFSGLLAWLRAHVHHHGQRYRPVDLIERATGAKPHHQSLITALKHKYGELYGV